MLKLPLNPQLQATVQSYALAPLRQAPKPHPAHRLPPPHGAAPHPSSSAVPPRRPAGEIFSAVGIYITRSARAPRDLTSLDGATGAGRDGVGSTAKSGPELGPPSESGIGHA